MSDQNSSKLELTEFQLDALQEVGNIGAGHSAIALTDFLNRSTYMSIPKVAVDEVENIHRLVKMPKDENVAIASLKTVSDLYYHLLVFLDQKSVRRIIDIMTTTQETKSTEITELSPLFLSLIKEIGSILLLKYVEALNGFLNAKSFPSPPILRVGSVESINENEIKEIKQVATKVLFIECDIFTSERNIQVDLAIIPHEDTFKRFMNSLFADSF